MGFPLNVTELFGADFLVNLTELYAARNSINNVTPSFDSISFLYLCPKMQTVTFRGNPIADAADYQERIHRYFPRLKSLDPMSRKYRIINDECNPKNDDLGSESPEDEEDFKLKIPETEELSDDEMKSGEAVDGIDEEMYKRFVA